jgi:NADH-quinone oxidoreductase subunit M
MLTPDLIRTLLPALIGLPFVWALVLRFVNGPTVRVLSLVGAIVHLTLTVVIVYSSAMAVQDNPGVTVDINNPKFVTERVFAPQFVPGDPLPNGKQSYSTTFDLVSFSANNPNIKAIQFFIGLDGLNIWLLLLSSFMLVPVLLYSWDSTVPREGAFYSWLFALQALVIGVFLSFDIILFYVCFELTLIPLLFLIGSWGTGPNRREAARTLFLFTLAGGLITLLGIAGTVLFIYDRTGVLTFSIPQLADLVQTGILSSTDSNRQLWADTQTYLFLAIAVGFAVKVPLVPLHGWLPGAYSEAPMGVTVLLSALLAKMGTFGLVRLCLPLAPDATIAVGMPLLGTLAVIGIIYGAFCAFAQTDIRKLVAYSSLSHLGFVVLAIVAFNATALGGAMLHMVNHALSTGAMFLLVGMLVRRYGSAQIPHYSGIWAKLPVLTFFMMVMALASIGLPGLNNFVSEMLMLAGVVVGNPKQGPQATAWIYAALAGCGIFLGAWYTLTMVKNVFFGPLKEPETTEPVKDLNTRERWAIAPVALLCVVLGVLPQPLLQVMSRDVTRLSEVGDGARERASKSLSTAKQN